MTGNFICQKLVLARIYFKWSKTNRCLLFMTFDISSALLPSKLILRSSPDRQCRYPRYFKTFHDVGLFLNGETPSEWTAATDACKDAGSRLH